MSKSLWRRPSPSTLLARLIESPDLVETVRALPSTAFSSLVQQIGVEDAGELVALATTEQIVTAFDEDLFVSSHPGQRERFEPRRFVVWLAILLEAGEATAAQRAAELSESFLIHAISQLVWVLDHDGLIARMDSRDQGGLALEKVLESALTEEIDGYLLVARLSDGWDATLSLILALDRDQRSLLELVLDRCAAMTAEYLDDLGALASVLSSADSLAEDVEAEREDRRSIGGFVEPRAAKAFLALARQPVPPGGLQQRDYLTLAYFRALDRSHSVRPASQTGANTSKLSGIVSRLVAAPALLSGGADTADPVGEQSSVPIVEALGLLCQDDSARFEMRLQELAYLANVLQAGTTLDGRRFRPAEAAEASLATVALGAVLLLNESDTVTTIPLRAPAAALLRDVLRDHPADTLFRRASSTLAANSTAGSLAYLRHRDEIVPSLEQLASTKNASRCSDKQ